MSANTQPTLEIVVSPPSTATSTNAFASANRAEALARNATDALSDLGSVLKEASGAFVRSLEGIAPNEIQLELSLSLEAEGKWLIVSGKAGATVGVTLTWKRNGG